MSASTVDSFEYMLRKSKELVTLATHCGGCVFGEFVRDVVGREINGVELGFCPNIIDFYFKSHASEAEFVGVWCPANDYALTCNRTSTSHGVRGDIQVKEYISVNGDKLVVHTTVCAVLPVDDFDVNCATYQRIKNKWVVQNELIVVEAIKNKEATMISGYTSLLLDDKKKFDQIKTDFFCRSWKVYFHDRAGNKYELYQETDYATFCNCSCINKPSEVAPRHGAVGQRPLCRFVPSTASITPKNDGVDNEWNVLVKQRNEDFAEIERLTRKVKHTNLLMDAHMKKRGSIPIKDKEGDRIKQLEVELEAQKAIVVQLKSILQ